MRGVRALVVAGMSAVAGIGVVAEGASAYAISGGAYTGTATAAHTFTVAGAFTLSCPVALTAFSGTATGAAATSFTPSFGSGTVCTFFGLPTSVAQSGTWGLEVTGGPSGGWYTGRVQIPASTVTTINTPLAGCTVTVVGAQNFPNGVAGNGVRGRNVSPTGVEVDVSVNGITYTASGCPFGSGSDGSYSTNGVVTVPGITIS